MDNFFKTTIICAAVSSIVACGGGSSNGGSVAETRLITAMDGLLYNAVVFVDTNDNLIWDKGESLLGLTDHQGQAKVTANSGDRLGVVTLIAGSPTNIAMYEQDPQYKNISTIDMDFPDTPMAKELYLVAPPSVDVMSPYTHLISSISAHQNIKPSEAQSLLAQQIETEGLVFDLLSDYVKNEDKQQQKLAQLLTDAMAQAPEEVYSNWQGYIQEGIQTVAQMSEVELFNSSFRPIIDGDTSTPVINNAPLIYNTEAWDVLIKKWNQIGDISAGDSGIFFSIDLNAINVNGESTPLFIDPDKEGQHAEYSLIGRWAQGDKQELYFDNKLMVKLEEDGSTLTVSSDEVFKAEHNKFFLVTTDKDSQGDKVLSNLSILELQTSSANEAPVVSDSAQTEMQQHIDANWSLDKGQPFEQILDLSQWFSDPEGDNLTYTLSGSLIELGLVGNQEQDRFVISGTPVRSYAEEAIRHNLVITADDGHNYTTAQVEVLLPKVADGVLIDANPLVGKGWYFIDEIEEDGIIKSYCFYVQFTGGKVKQTTGDNYDHHGCNKAESSAMSLTSYNEVNLTTITEAILFNTKTYTVRYSQPTDTGVAYAVTIDHFKGQDHHDVHMFYSNKAEVEQRLDIDSNQTPFEYALPIEGEIMQTLVTPEVGDDYIKLSFDKKLKCEQLRHHFDQKYINSDEVNVFGVSSLCKDELDGISVAPYYTLQLFGMKKLETGRSYYVNFEYRHAEPEQYGESLRLNFVKD